MQMIFKSKKQLIRNNDEETTKYHRLWYRSSFPGINERSLLFSTERVEWVGMMKEKDGRKLKKRGGKGG